MQLDRARGAVVVDLVAALECREAVGVRVHLGARRVHDVVNLSRDVGAVSGLGGGHRQRQNDVLVELVGLIEPGWRRLACELLVRGGEGSVRGGVEVVGDLGGQNPAGGQVGHELGDVGHLQVG